MKFDFLKQCNQDKVLLFFSGGKDSIVSLDLLQKQTKIKEVIGVYLYFVPDLQYKNEMIAYYAKKYNIIIHQLPHPFYLLYQQNNVYGIENRLNKKYSALELKLGNYQRKLKLDFNIEYGVLGYKKTDSITRARQFYKYSAVDIINKYIYPVAYFSDKEIFYYIKKNKLKLPVEYQHDFKGDITTPFSKEILLFLKANYIKDYEKIIDLFPQIESIFYNKT